jgi:hypothetical protein
LARAGFFAVFISPAYAVSLILFNQPFFLEDVQVVFIPGQIQIAGLETAYILVENCRPFKMNLYFGRQGISTHAVPAP